MCAYFLCEVFSAAAASISRVRSTTATRIVHGKAITDEEGQLQPPFIDVEFVGLGRGGEGRGGER